MEVWNTARLLETNSRSHDKVVRSMSLLMKSKFEKYWEDYSDILSMGAVFDPRTKLKLVEYCYSTLDPLSSQDKVNRLKMKLYTLYDEYKKKMVDASLSKGPQSSGSSNHEVGELKFIGGGGLVSTPPQLVYTPLRLAAGFVSTIQDEVVKSMSLKMKLKFEKYWEEYSEILSMGAVFDPRMKLEVLEYFYSRIDHFSSKDKILKLEMQLYTLYDEYKRRGVRVSLFKVPQASSGSSTSQVRELESKDKEEARRKEMNRALNCEEDELIYKTYKGATSEAKSSLDMYLEEAKMVENVELDLHN
ncbi:hypothetical protein SASPL_117877 [Salvia splendens]|uniref:hAT-like transposase RNase-H fold domain-containing protein n=1 Tax=Salvia splendens TaxID=180675 RepID=A0A8X8XVS0_SALSN|nr:hypothetical protein SASPL_117877 [Salvia splendens]